MKLKEILGRLTGIKEQDTVHHGEAIMPSPFDSPRYEQGLWDKVAIAAIPALITNPSEWSGDNEAGGEIRSYTDAAKAASYMADAFMAERSKRLKGAVK